MKGEQIVLISVLISFYIGLIVALFFLFNSVEKVSELQNQIQECRLEKTDLDYKYNDLDYKYNFTRCVFKDIVGNIVVCNALMGNCEDIKKINDNCEVLK